MVSKPCPASHTPQSCTPLLMATDTAWLFMFWAPGMQLKQPAHGRAWQSSQIPWPGCWPQAHPHIPGAVTLFMESELPLGTTLEIKEKLPPIFRLQDKCKQRCFASKTTKFCGFLRMFCTSPNTPCSLLFLPLCWPLMSYSLSLGLSLMKSHKKKLGQNILPTQSQHPMGMPDTYVGFLGMCAGRSPVSRGYTTFNPDVSCFGFRTISEASLIALCAEGPKSFSSPNPPSLSLIPFPSLVSTMFLIPYSSFRKKWGDLRWE